MQLERESRLVRESSMEALREFELLDDLDRLDLLLDR